MIAEHRASLPREAESKIHSPSVTEGSIYATSTLNIQGPGPFTSGTQRGESTGAYFPSSAGAGLGQEGTNTGGFSHLGFGSESALLEELAEGGSKKKKVTSQQVFLRNLRPRG